MRAQGIIIPCHQKIQVHKDADHKNEQYGKQDIKQQACHAGSMVVYPNEIADQDTARQEKQKTGENAPLYAVPEFCKVDPENVGICIKYHTLDCLVCGGYGSAHRHQWEAAHDHQQIDEDGIHYVT